MSSEENSGSTTDSKGKTIKVDVSLSEEIKRLMADNTRLTDKVAEQSDLALRLFESDKETAIRNFPKYAQVLKECHTPETLQKFIDVADSAQSKEGIVYGTHPENRQAPSGKASMDYRNSGAETFESPVELIDSLYDKAYYHSSQFTKDQVADAKKKIETLIESMVSGKSWSELKQRGKTSELMKHEISSCSACGATQIDNYEGKCSQCGFDPKEKGPRQTRHYKPPETRGV
jgi:ribosomal protein L37E